MMKKFSTVVEKLVEKLVESLSENRFLITDMRKIYC